MSSQEAASLLPLPSHVHPRQVADASCTASHGTSLLKSSNGGLVPFPKKALRSAPSPKNSRRLATVSHTLRLVRFLHSQLQLSVSYVSDLTTFVPSVTQHHSQTTKQTVQNKVKHRSQVPSRVKSPLTSPSEKPVPTRPAAPFHFDCTSQGRLP